MVRLVFRPYTQLRRSICTSESLRSSIRVSPDFNLARHSSPSFGSQQTCSSYAARYKVYATWQGCAYTGSPLKSQVLFAFTTPLGLVHPMTCTHVRLLGPCFKTGRRGHRPTHDRNAARVNEDTRYTRQLSYLPAPNPRTQGSNTRNELHPCLQSDASSTSCEALEKCSR